MIENLHFIRPYFFLLFIILFFIVWKTLKAQKHGNAWAEVCDNQLLSYLLVQTGKKRGYLPIYLMLLVGGLLIVAVSGPTWEKLPQAVYKNESAIVFVLDLSSSMRSSDVKPTRESRAKLKLLDYLEKAKEGQSALIVFAAEPHVVSPLTDDANTIALMVPSLSTEIMPQQGSRTDRAIIKAAQLLRQANSPQGDIVLITDGVNFDSSVAAAERVSAAGYRLNIIGVGTKDGAPIPVRQGGFLKDKTGAIVIPKLDKANLKEVALAGSGKYVDMSIDDRDIDSIVTVRLDENLASENAFEREVDLWKDEGHWFLLLALPFAALGFRRGWLGAVLLVVLINPVNEVYAFEWKDLWQTKDQQAHDKMDKGEFEAAAKEFENPEWQGAAHYRNENYEQAVEAFSKSDSVEAKYNKANALAKLGRLDEAIEAYDEVLEQNPDHKDAEFNKEVVKKLLKNQQQSQDQSGDEGENSDENEQSDSQNQKSDSENSDSQQQSSSEQENSEENENSSDQQQAQNQKSDQEQQDEEQNQDSKQQGADGQDSENEGEKQEPVEEDQQSGEKKEVQQATEQWLRRVPDDPGGLLREKFSRQHQRERQRNRQNSVENPW